MKQVMIIFYTIMISFLSCSKENQIPKDDGEVPEEITNKIALHFDDQSFKLDCNRMNDIENIIPIKGFDNKTALRIYNFKNNNGFIVLSAVHNHEPICAVVKKGNFIIKDSIPAGLYQWYVVVLKNINLVKYGKVDNKKRSKQEWERLLTSLNENKLKKAPKEYNDCEQNYYSYQKGPYLTTEWGQGIGFNDNNPYSNCNISGYGGRAPAGCGPIAMSQIMYYWKKQTSANFAYASMPLKINRYYPSNTPAYQKAAVSGMVRHIGVAVNTIYTCNWSMVIPNFMSSAFKNSYGFSNAEYNMYSGNYNSVISNLDYSKPVILGGCTAGVNILNAVTLPIAGCHEWVCDGYKSYGNSCYSYLNFHMNWGWDGNFNGWYGFNQWIVDGNTYSNYFTHYTHNITP